MSRRPLPVALLLSSHPAPAVAVTLVAFTLAIAVGLPPLGIALVTVVFAVNQLSIGWSNDWIDADRDRAAGRRDKPVARGDIPVAAVRAAALLALAVSCLLAFGLGPAAGAVHLVFVLSAWAYNAGLKSTPLSVVPYVVSFGLLPAVGTLAAEPPRFAAWWAVLAGALLGVAAHFTNVLPDLDDDRATGVRGLPHRLGLRPAGVVAFAALAVGALVVAGSAPGVAALAGLAAVLLLCAAGILLVVRRRISRLLFTLVLVAAVILVAMLAASGGSLSS
ncbi:UbiA family prenyltransferase [Naasia sp. SYSU D00948]|uniref:UbiA family prenyltransferase n=1 Tax=Naasia sp. SYSU D00948 TaxID=2817379 RepID=UPI001B309CA8|nr:UbiA family prenyltransferase [Naasia sp. SYSU D00948]